MSGIFLRGVAFSAMLCVRYYGQQPGQTKIHGEVATSKRSFKGGHFEAGGVRRSLYDPGLGIIMVEAERTTVESGQVQRACRSSLPGGTRDPDDLCWLGDNLASYFYGRLV